MKLDYITDKARRGEDLTHSEAMELYEKMETPQLMMLADLLRRQAVADPKVVTWQIDRNVNITNVCVSACKFCNFHALPREKERHFVTSLDQYIQKIEETIALGGDQLLLQGGLHPNLDITYYEELFRELKSRFPNVKLHALGAPEVAHIARISKLEPENALRRLVDAGLDSLPGAGAEILVERVRKAISPGKPSVEEWIDTMRIAHRMGLATSATMMYGHVETLADSIEHLIKLRNLQAERPEGSYGFVAFIPWIFHSKGTLLEKDGIKTNFSPLEYIRLIAISRIVLNNITNIQASWLTVGKQTAQIALHAGANDLGSIMIEENVVSSAGADNQFDADGIQKTITEAGFTPRLRDQKYKYRKL